MIKAEIKRSLNLVIVLILTIIGIICLYSNCYSFIGGRDTLAEEIVAESIEEGFSKEEQEEIGAVVSEDSNQYLNSYMAWRFSVWGYEIVCILLSTGVFAISYIIDKKTGILKSILLRVEKKKYYTAKYLINAISGGLIVILPVIIITVFFMIKFGVSDLPTLSVYFPLGFMSEYFPTHPMLYISFFMLVLFFIGVTYSTFAMAIAVISKNIIATVLVPLMYWFAGSLICEALNLYKLAPWNIYYFYCEDILCSFKAGLIHTSILFIISSIIIYIESKKENI